MFIFYSGFGLHGVCAAFCFFVVVPYVFIAILAFIFVFLWGCLDQQHCEKEGQAVVVVEDFPISDLDDSSNLDCICCLKDHNYSVVVGFAAKGVYYKCLQHKLQVAH